MQYIWDLSDNHDRLQAMASSLQPSPEDHDQRLSQLYTSVRSIIDELRQDCTQYTLAMGDWDVLNTEHLSEDSEWSRLMLQHRRTFFEDPAFIPKQLDEKQMDLLAHYYQLQHRIEDILLEREAATATTNLRNRAANSAAGYPDLSVIQKQCANLRLGTQPATDDFGQRRSTDNDARRSQNVFGEPLPPPIPMGWSTARGGSRKNPQRPTANSAAGTAPSSGLAANSAACHLGGRGFNATVTSGPPQDHKKTMMSSFASSATEKKPNIASSGALQVGADGKPFIAGTTDLKQLPPTREDADFGPENTSAFYRNATYQRSANAAAPWPALKDLPFTPFTGEDRAYPAFRNNFLELVESQPRLEPRHKMQYLLQYLRGEPYQLVNAYAITDVNYFTVIDLLEERYGDKQRIGLKLLQRLVTMPPPSEDAKDLRKFHDECSRLVSELRQCGENPDATAMISQMLLSKLPQPVRQEIVRRAGPKDGSTTTQDVLVQLYDHLRILDRSESVGFNWNAQDSCSQLCCGDPKSHARHQPSSRNQNSRYTNLMADAEIVSPKCAYCDGPHWAPQCHVYDTIAKRKRRTRQLSYCYFCLRSGHWIATCPKRTDEPCRYCNNGRHHQSLCLEVIRWFNDLRRDPMCAKKKEQATQTAIHGTPSAASPKDDHGIPSSPPRPVHQSWNAVNWLKPNPNEGSTVDKLRFASAPSSEHGRSNSTVREKKPSRKDRTDLEGLHGTCDPPAEITHESMKTKDAHASGTAELLLTQKSLRTTDRCSHQDEMMQFDRAHGGGHLGHQPSGPLTDDTLGVNVTEPTPRFTTGYTGETEATAPLVECLLATIKNPWTDDSCAAVVAFDRQRHASLITKELVYALKLPAAESPTADLDTFTGYHTSIDLLLPGGSKLPLHHLATGRLPKEVRTVLLDEKLLAALRRSQRPPDVISAQPHLLIGMDEMLRLQYRHGPRLHGGLFSVHTRIGVALGGSLDAASDSSSTPPTSSQSCSFVFTDSDAEAAEKPSRRRKLSKASRKDALRSSLNIRPVPQVAGPPANSAGDTATGGQLTDEKERARYRAYLQQKSSGPFDHIFIDYMTSESEWRSFVQVEKMWAEAGYASGYLTWATSAQDTAALTTHEGLEPSTSTSSSSGQMPPCSRCSHRHEERPCSKRFAHDTMPQPPQKQSSTKPLDTSATAPAGSSFYLRRG